MGLQMEWRGGGGFGGGVGGGWGGVYGTVDCGSCAEYALLFSSPYQLWYIL